MSINSATKFCHCRPPHNAKDGTAATSVGYKRAVPLEMQQSGTHTPYPAPVSAAVGAVTLPSYDADKVAVPALESQQLV